MDGSVFAKRFAEADVLNSVFGAALEVGADDAVFGKGLNGGAGALVDELLG